MRVLLLLIFLTLSVLAHGQSKYSRVKIYGDRNSIGKLDITLDHVHTKQGEFVVGIFSDYELKTIRSSGLRFEILTDDVTSDYLNNVQKKFSDRSDRSGCEVTPVVSPLDTITVPQDFALGTMGGFLKYEEMLAHLDNMAAKYPNLITVKKAIFNPQAGANFATHQNRPIYYVKISDNATDDESSEETQLLYTALHHAREPGSLSQLIFYMYYVLENYGKNDWITHLVDNREMIFVPCVNPDGYIYNQTTNPNGGGMWRKNRRPNAGGSFGVDLNRNYSYQWGVSGTSSDPNSDVYKGPSPFSEPENQAIRSLCQQFSFKMAFNYHSHGDLLLFPYGYGTPQAPDHNRYTILTEEMVAQNNYVNEQSVLLYAAAGDSDDYMYGNTTDKPRIFAMTPEVGDDFWIPQSAILPLCKENLWQNISMGLQSDVYPSLKSLTSSIDALTGNVSFTVEARGLNALQNAQLTVVSKNAALTTGTASAIGNVNAFQVKTITVPYEVAAGTPNGTVLNILCTVTFNNGKTINYPFKLIWKGSEAVVGQVIFEDDFTSLDRWATSGTWALTTNSYASEPTAITDSPTGNYNNYVNMKIDTRDAIDLNGLESAYLIFKARWNIESNDDYLQLTIVKNNVEYPICGNYSRVNNSGRIVYDGNQNSWITEQINLSDFLGDEIKLRFRLKSDASTTADGFYLDDVAVLGVAAFDDEAPVLESIVPANNAVVSVDQEITIRFSENIYVSNENQIVLKRLSDHTVVETEIEVSGKEISIIPASLEHAKQYYLEISATAIADLSGNYFSVMNNNDWKFSTSAAPDVTAPLIAALLPVSGSTSVAEDVVLTAQFNEPVSIQSSLISLLDDQEQEVPVTISLADQTTVTLIPDNDLLPGKTYSVQFGAGSVEDLSGNAFTGLTSEWSFTTKLITSVETRTQSLKIFPNPADDIVSVSMENPQTIRQIQIIDALGKTTSVKWNQINESLIQFAVNELAEGLYLVRIEDTVQRQVLRLLIK